MKGINRVPFGLAAFCVAMIAGNALFAVDMDRVRYKGQPKDVFIIQLGIDEVQVGFVNKDQVNAKYKTEEVTDILDWGSAPDAFIMAYRAYRENRVGEAKKYMEMALKDNADEMAKRPPVLQCANFVLGKSCAALGEYAKAQEYYGKIKEKEYYYPSANFGLGHILLSQKKYDDAIKAFEIVKAPAARKAEAQYLIGSAFLSQNKTKEAIGNFEKISEPVSIKAQAMAGIGIAYLQEKNYDKAQNALKDAEKTVREIEDDEDKKLALAVVYNGYGDIAMKDNNFDEAAMAYLRTITLYNRNRTEYIKALFGACRAYAKQLKAAAKNSDEARALTARIRILKSELMDAAPKSEEAEKAKNNQFN